MGGLRAFVALSFWRALSAELGADRLGSHQGGVVYLNDDEAVLSGYEVWIRRTAGLRPDDGQSRLLNGNEVRRLLKTDRKSWRGGLLTESDCRVEPALTSHALAEAAQRSGAVLLTGCAVRGLETSGGHVSAVMTEKGRVETRSVVLAAGAWSGLFCRSLDLSLPQLKVLATVCRTKPAPLVTNTNVYAPGAAFRRRQDGGYTIAAGQSEIFPLVPDAFRFIRPFWSHIRSEILSGSIRPRLDGYFLRELSYERRWQLDQISPFERCRVLNPKPDMKAVHRALRTVEGFSKEFGSLQLEEAWAGMIDVLPDVLPVLGAVKTIPGFYLATGFSGHGFGIGPAVGHTMADLVSEGEPVVDLHPFRFDRFSDGSDLTTHVHL